MSAKRTYANALQFLITLRKNKNQKTTFILKLFKLTYTALLYSLIKPIIVKQRPQNIKILN